MESWRKRHITRNLPFLVSNTICNVGLLAELVSNDVITKEDKENIVRNFIYLSLCSYLQSVLRSVYFHHNGNYFKSALNIRSWNWASLMSSKT